MKYGRGRNYPFLNNRGTRPAAFSHEKHDCTVVALATCTGLPYDEVHAYLKSEGRIDGRVFASYTAYISAGMREVQFDGGHVRTYRKSLGWWLKSGLLPARCIVRIRGHVFAVIDGVVHDGYPAYSGTRVMNIFAP